jgi:hypothetical protein
MTDQEKSQVLQALNTVFIVLQQMNMPMTEHNLQMMNVAQSNVKAVLKLLQDNNEIGNKIDENKN